MPGHPTSRTHNGSGSISPAAVPSKHGLGRVCLCKVISCWTSSPAQIIAQTHSTKARDLGATELLKRALVTDNMSEDGVWGHRLAQEVRHQGEVFL